MRLPLIPPFAVWLFGAWLLAFAGAAAAQPGSQRPSASAPEPRLALLIGNANYRADPLLNPVNDVRLMNRSLQAVGFETIVLENANLEQSLKAVNEFARRLERGKGVGLFYYAGHAVQLGGENYLVPIDGSINNEEEVRARSLVAQEVIDKMRRARNRLNLVFFDACRNDPFVKSTRSGVKGLARMDAGLGMLIAYATAPGAVAEDGKTGNSPFSKHLAGAVLEPGLRVEDVLKRVRTAVREETKGRQITWDNSAIEGDFFFQPRAAAASNPSKPAGAAPTTPRDAPAADPAKAQALEAALKQRFEPGLTMQTLKPGMRFFINDRVTESCFQAGVGAIKCELQDVRGKVLVFDKIEPFTETVRGQPEERRRLHFLVEGAGTQRFALEKLASSLQPDNKFVNAVSDQFLPLDEIDAFKAILVGQTVFALRPFWYDSAGELFEGSRKFVPLKVSDVRLGTTGYQQIRIVFDGPDGKKLFFFSRLDGLDDSFVLADPKQKHPQVRESAWDWIEQAKAQPGMSQQEVELALGKPRTKASTQRADGTVDVWNYHKRRVTFTDGRVSEIADSP